MSYSDSGKMFVDVRIGEDFNWKGELYCKVSYESAMPISFKGDEKEFAWNEPID